MQDRSGTVLDYLQANRERQSCTYRITWGSRRGILKIHNDIVTAAETEHLHGVAAALYISRWQDATIDVADHHWPTKKRIAITLDKLRAILDKLRFGGTPFGEFDREGVTTQAVRRIHQFRYPEAGAQLINTIKQNRFDYVAWLWYSRLLSRLDVIEKAVLEAKRWSGNDPSIALEASKLESGRKTVRGLEVKRCVFCWTPLNPAERQCCFCRAKLDFSSQPLPAAVRADALTEAISQYQAALANGKPNSRVAYTLGLAHYNLGDFGVAEKYLAEAVRIAPASPIYAKAHQLVEKLVSSAVSPIQDPPAKATGPVPVVREAVAVMDSDKPVILVVEDSPTARKVITVVLDRAGYRYIEAATGAEALKKAESATPNLVLLDVMLPDTTGYDVLEKMRDLDHLVDTPVVMLTGRTGSLDRRRGLLAGSAEYLTKPFNPHKLTATIKRFL